MLRSFVGVVVFVVVSAGLAAENPSLAQSLTSDFINFRLALTLKTLADEQFIRGETATAQRTYQDASRALQQIDGRGSWTR